jgi:glycerol-3-phosphate dehydrogenase
VAAHPELEESVASGLARRLGSLAWTACDLGGGAEGLRPLDPDLDLCAGEVRAHLRYGGVLHLEDLLLRRARLGMWNPSRARELVPRLRELVCAQMGWDSRRWDEEQERYAAAAVAWAPEGAREPGETT